MEGLKLALISLAILVLYSDATIDEPLLTYDILYTSGKESYYQERWFECSESLQRAIEDRRFYHDGLAECRILCQENVGFDKHGSLSELSFFGSALKRSDCIRRCKLRMFKNRPDAISAEVDREFATHKTYDFLQICAYKSGNAALGADAAFTFSLAHPDHPSSEHNVNFFIALPEIKGQIFTNLEHKSYQTHFVKAVVAYDKQDWYTALQHMEPALSEFYQEVQRCSALCEGPYDHESLPEFYNAIADHWLHVLECKSACANTLSEINFTPRPDMHSDFYNYLQFTYFKVSNTAAAARCASSYLVLNPGDEVMTRNLDYYSSQDDVHKDDLTARPEVVEFAEHQNQLNSQMEWMKLNYKFSAADEDSKGMNTEEQEMEEEIVEDTSHVIKPYKNNAGITIVGSQYHNPIIANPAILGPRDEAFLAKLDDYLGAKHLEIVSESDELLGDYRVAADGFMDDKQCQALIDLARDGAAQGDGYKERSPHTEFEMFEGLNLSRTVELALRKEIEMVQARLYLGATEAGREFLEKYFNLQTPLFFHFTHLVCRTAITNKAQNNRDDLSHPVHTDNCYMLPDGTCLRQSPAYFKRDFSGLIYLNDEFEGGDFFFAHQNRSVQKSLRPKCGRMVGFEASDFHGVLPVTKGRRCAVALWFTLDPLAQETAHAQGVAQLDAMEAKSRKLSDPSLKSLVKENGYDISYTEAELNGPERFAAEHLATQDQCQQLIDLANKGTVHGKGYGVLEGKPQSTLEQFEGLGVLRAAQLAAEAKVDAKAVRLFLSVSERSRELVAKYFNLERPLYFDYTHLACRTALDDENTVRSDLSHPIHSDNCIIQPDTSCLKQRPAYTQRDYSALVYLNNDFDGGDFFFTHQNFSIQSSLRPQCGRLVGFNASNYHGVKAVISGQRCALAVWFTLDPFYKEVAHTVANQILDNLDESNQIQGPPKADHSHPEL